MRLSLVIFDLDGTLLDTSEGIMRTIDKITKYYNFRPLSVAEKRSFIGPPIQDSLERQYGLTKERAWEIASHWREIYKDEFLFYATPYEGIYDILKFCRERGIKTGVATNKREDYTRRLLEHFQFTPLFDSIVGTDFKGELKKPDLIRICMEHADIKIFDECLMVGDTENDRKAAEKAGVNFIGVTYGFGYTKGAKLTKESRVPLIDNCMQLKRWLSP